MPATTAFLPVSVDLTNFGADSLSSVSFNWSVGGQTQVPVTINFTGADKVPPLGDTVLNIGSFNSTGSATSLVVNCHSPNGMTDIIIKG